jgi:hypothetical protein
MQKGIMKQCKRKQCGKTFPALRNEQYCSGGCRVDEARERYQKGH